MRVTVKGQVTIPRHIRLKLGITAGTEVDFVEEGDRVRLVKKRPAPAEKDPLHRLRGISTVRMSTDEIMSLTRGIE